MAETPAETPAIRAWHAHVYFDPATRERAVALRARIEQELGLTVGRVHDRPVGPHTKAMFQVLFTPADFARFVPWLALNRDDLAVLIHPETGDDRTDHTRHALWMGAMLDVNVSVFG